MNPALLLPLLMIVIIAACSGTVIEHDKVLLTKPHSASCRIVQHAMGETCIPLNPQRIVITDTQALFYALALDIKPIAVFGRKISFDISYIKDRLKAVETIPSTSNEPNYERLLLLKPDLIIGYSENQESYRLLSQISSTISLPSMDFSSGDWKQDFLNTAAIFKKVEIANQLIDEYEHRAEKLKQTINNHQQSKFSVAYLEAGAGLSYLSRNDSFAGQILNDVGFQLPPVPSHAELFQGSLPISEEALPEIDNDVLFVGTYRDDKSTLEKVQQKPLWSHIKAVQKNQVYAVSAFVWRGYNIFAANAVLDDIEKHLINTL